MVVQQESSLTRLAGVDFSTSRWRYTLAVSLVAAGLVVLLLFPALFEPQPYLIFALAAVLAAWLGGWEPGVLAALLGILAALLFHQLDGGDPALDGRAALWLAAALGLALLVGSLRRAYADLRAAQAPSPVPATGPPGADAMPGSVEMIYSLTQLLAEATTSYPTLLEQAARHLSEAFGDPCLIFLGAANGDQPEVVVYDDPDPEMTASVQKALRQAATTGMQTGAPMANDVFRTGEPLLLRRGDLERFRPRYDPESWSFFARINPKSLMVVPLWNQNTIIGVMYLLRREGARPEYDHADLRLAQSLAGRIALAISNSRLYQEVSQQREQFRVTLASIGDAVIATDAAGIITFLNPAAEQLTGWPHTAAQGRPLDEVFHLSDEQTGRPVESPVERVLRENRVIGIANHSVLTRRDGTRFPIADSGAPIRNADGTVTGVVLVFRDVSQQREAARALALSEERLRAAIKMVPLVVFSQDRDLRYTWIYNSLAGFTTDIVQGRTDQDLLTDPDEVAAITAIKRQVLETGIGVRRTISMQRHGQPVTFDLSVEPLRTNGDEPSGVICAALDITESRQQEERLAQALAAADREKRRLRAVLDQLPVGVFIADAGGRIAAVNHETRRMFGDFPLPSNIHEYSTYTGYWSDTGELIAPEEWALARAVLRGEAPSGDLVDIDLIDGTRATVLNSAAPIHDENGQIIGAVAVLVDLTERRRAVVERDHLLGQIAQERDRLSTLIDSIADEVWLVDNQARVELVNPAVFQAFGLSIERLKDIGTLAAIMDGVEVYTGDGRPRPLDDTPLLRSLHGEVVRNEVEILRHSPEGSLCYRRVSSVPFTNAAGDITGAVAVVHDITDEMQAKEEIYKLNTELEQRVRERTAQLRAVNRELEAFSYSVSHDLRTPLRAINGFSHALLEDYGESLDAEGRYHLERIRMASQRLGQLIDDLLKLSRLSRSEIQSAPVNLSDLTREIVSELREAQPDRAITITVQPDVVADGDARLLRVALSNLLANAWKFTGKAPDPQIEFGTLDYDDERVYYVRDNGAGFDMAYADKLFRAFQRLHNTAEFEGTGIGLATVQRIIHRHGGRIWAQAAPAEGATFYFTLSIDTGNPYA